MPGEASTETADRDAPMGRKDGGRRAEGYLIEAKARTRLVAPLLDAAGLHGLPYTRYHEIAALMLPEEIHPEVIEKLDAICRAFGVEP